MALHNRLGGHSNSYHTFSLEEALEGIAAAGYKFVKFSAVRGWTEHVPLSGAILGVCVAFRARFPLVGCFGISAG